MQDERFNALLDSLNLQEYYIGYYYLRDILALAVEDRSRIHAILKELYIPVAEQHCVEPSAVESALRNLIGHWWAGVRQGTSPSLDFAHRPTVSGFLRELVARMLME